MSCPYIFYLKNRLFIKDIPFSDFEPDPLQRGNIIHKVLEQMYQEGFFYELLSFYKKYIESKSELDLEHFRESLENWLLEKLLDEVPQYFINRVSYRIEKFIDEEFKFFSLRPIATHTEFNFSGRLLNTNMEYRGSIDRVDEYEEGYVVIDYKWSTQKLKNWSHWVDEKSYQLLLYAHAIESGHANLPPKPVIGAVYLDLDSGKRQKGYVRRECINQELNSCWNLTKGSKLWIEEEDYQKLMEQFIQDLKQTEKHIENEQFDPYPKNLEMCSSCNWRAVCPRV